ncbi:hypothetical protein GCM10010399_09110 [Dactylosporangium fulvum]
MSGRQWVGLAVLAVCVALFVAASARWQHQFDLRIYHGAVRSWAHGGDLYAYRQPETVRVFGFIYPPFAAIAMLPMTIVAWPVAAVALAITSVSGTLLLWRRFHRWAPTLAGDEHGDGGAGVRIISGGWGGVWAHPESWWGGEPPLVGCRRSGRGLGFHRRFGGSRLARLWCC